MTCRNLGGVMVCGPPGIYHRLQRKCWTCETEARMVESWDGAYYGTTVRCLECGDVWSDGCRYGRPFQRHWKRDRLKLAQELWDNAASDEDYEAYVKADVHLACANSEEEVAALIAEVQAVYNRIKGVAE